MIPTKVVFTIDTEHGNGGDPIRISGDLSKYGINENYGVPAIMDIFEKHDMHAVFFVNVYEAGTYDPPNKNYMETIVAEIHDRGHEVGLHWHSLSINQPCYQSSSPDKLLLSEQTKMIKKGVDYIEKYTGVKPISYRAGAYRINDDTLSACEANGIIFESSMWYGNHNNAVSYYRTINAPYRENSITEIPIASVITHYGKNTKLDFDCLSIDQIIEAFDNMRNYNYPIIQIMFHSFSLLKKVVNKEDTLFCCKDKLYSGGDNEKKQKLDNLLSFLRLSSNYEVCTFRDIQNNEFDFSHVLDGFIPTNYRNSIETAKALNAANGKIIPINSVTLDISVHHYCIKYNSSNCLLHFVLKTRKQECCYAYYLQDEKGDTLKTLPYTDSPECVFKIEKQGKYRIKYYFNDAKGKVSYNSKYVSLFAGKDFELEV